MSIYSDPNTSKKDFRIFVGTLSQIKEKETAGTISFCQMLFATDTREFFLGNKLGKAIKYGSAAGVSDSDLKALFSEVADAKLADFSTIVQASVDAKLANIGDIALDSEQIAANKAAIGTHIARTDNPHQVTKAQIGLSDVDNTSDSDKPISAAVQTALDSKQNSLASLYDGSATRNIVGIISEAMLSKYRYLIIEGYIGDTGGTDGSSYNPYFTVITSVTQLLSNNGKVSYTIGGTQTNLYGMILNFSIGYVKSDTSPELYLGYCYRHWVHETGAGTSLSGGGLIKVYGVS